MEVKRQKVGNSHTGKSNENDKEFPKFSVKLIPDWELIITNKGNKFYYNSKTRESKWVLDENNESDTEVVRYVDDNLDKDSVLVLIAKARGLKIVDDVELEDESMEQQIYEEEFEVKEDQDDASPEKAVFAPSNAEPIGLVMGYGSSSESEEEEEEEEEEEDEDKSQAAEEELVSETPVHEGVQDSAKLEVPRPEEEEEEGEEEEDDEVEEEEEEEGNGLNLSDLEGLSDSDVNSESENDLELTDDETNDNFDNNNDNDDETNEVDLKDKKVLKFLKFIDSKSKELEISPFSNWDFEIGKLIEFPDFYSLSDDETRRNVFDYWCSVIGHGGTLPISNNEEEVDEKEEEEVAIDESQYPIYRFVKYVIQHQESRKPKKPARYFVEFKRVVRSDPDYKNLQLDDKSKEKTYKLVLKIQDTIKNRAFSDFSGFVKDEVVQVSKKLGVIIDSNLTGSLSDLDDVIRAIGRVDYTKLRLSCISLILLDLASDGDDKDEELVKAAVSGVINGLK